MKRPVILSTLLMSMLLGLPLTSAAQSLIYEPFDYTPGTTLGGNGPAQGLAASWTGGMLISTNDLSYGVMVQEGVSAELLNPVAGVSFSNVLANAGVMEHGTSVWFSMVWRTGENGVSRRKGFSIGTDFLDGTFGVGMTNSGQGVGFRMADRHLLSASIWTNGSYASSTELNLATSSNVFIVGEILWGADSNALDTVNLYLPDEELKETGPIIRSISAVVDQSAFDVMCFSMRNGVEYVDELRVGPTYKDVAGLPPPKGMVIKLD